jgi:hypothetical protein
MQNGSNQTSPGSGPQPDAEPGQSGVGPDLPSLSGVLIGSVLFVTGGMLIFTIIGIPFGLLLFAAGLGLMLTPKNRNSG